jgi:phage terminase large subunit GpA-like protein
LGATTLAKDLLLNRLEIPVAGPGFIHIGTPDRGFDEAWSKEMTSERKEIVFRGGVQRTVWRKISTSQANDAWDLCCMTLILIESMKLRFDEKTKPDFYDPEAAKEGDVKGGQPTRPTWGVQPSSGVMLEGMPIGPKVPVGSVPQHQERPRSRFGFQNTPITW